VATDLNIVFVDGLAMQARWEDIEFALRRTFKDAVFNDDGYTVENPIQFTRAGVDGRLGPGLKHLLALDEMGEVLGGFFCVPTQRTEGRASCDIGWLFVVSELDRATQRRMVDSLVQQALQAVKEAGFERIVTNMGTLAGAKSLGQHYGFVHSPTTEKSNHWIKEL
jgi:hypothetical protein